MSPMAPHDARSRDEVSNWEAAIAIIVVLIVYGIPVLFIAKAVLIAYEYMIHFILL